MLVQINLLQQLLKCWIFRRIDTDWSGRSIGFGLIWLNSYSSSVTEMANEQEKEKEQVRLIARGNATKWQIYIKQVWAKYNALAEKDKTNEVFYYRFRDIEGDINRRQTEQLPNHRFFHEFVALVEHQRPNELYSSRQSDDLVFSATHPVRSSTLRAPYSTAQADVEQDRYTILVEVSEQMRPIYEAYRVSVRGTQGPPLPVPGVGRGRGSGATSSTTPKPSTVSKPPSDASDSTSTTSESDPGSPQKEPMDLSKKRGPEAPGEAGNFEDWPVPVFPPTKKLKT